MAFALSFGATNTALVTDAASQAAASRATLDVDDALSLEEVSATPWEAGFGEMDANGDGKVTKPEFKGYMADMKNRQKHNKANSGDI